jgi:hypothetical protein
LIIGICVVVSLFLRNKQYKEISNANIKAIKKLIIGGAFIAMSILFISIFLGSQIRGISKAKQIMEKGLFKVIEGNLENYHPMPKEGHDNESFDIGGVHFDYGDFQIKFGYSNAASLGGVIRPGNYYRITYYEEPYNNAIIRIEMQE